MSCDLTQGVGAGILAGLILSLLLNTVGLVALCFLCYAGGRLALGAASAAGGAAHVAHQTARAVERTSGAAARAIDKVEPAKVTQALLREMQTRGTPYQQSLLAKQALGRVGVKPGFP